MTMAFAATAVDLAIAVLVIETLLLLLVWRLHRRGLHWSTTALISAAGLGLLFALRSALTGASPLLVLAGLTIGGMAHATDLYRRLKAR